MNGQMKESCNMDELMDENISPIDEMCASNNAHIYMEMWIGSWMGQFQD